MASVESVPAYLQPGVVVSHPSHLEGDPSLATEILPGPPPVPSKQQAGAPKKEKDPKTPALTYSYLPISDPGTTYTTHFFGSVSAAPTVMDGSRRKRARLDKGAESSRSQRASARSLAQVAPHSDHIVLPEATTSSSHALSDFDPALLPLDSDDAIVSRATSFHAEDSPPETVELPKRHRMRTTKEKGKGREKDTAVKVKEEPGVVSLSGEMAQASSNQDHCSACRSLGALVYCDGCPRAFHWLCLDPPMEATDLPEGESRWFCPACVLEQRPSPKPSTSLKFMAPLVNELAFKIPSEFQLPLDIRNFFKDVGTGPRGAYQDVSEVKPARFNRHGQLEDRDPFRLKDRNGDPVLCFRCNTSALPPGLSADAPAIKRARRASTSHSTNYDTGRAIISCDYCHLHWHLDCVDPPMSLMPVWSKKWMCPNHAEQVLQPKRRVPKANAIPIDITKTRQWNNGNIDVIQADTVVPSALVPDKLSVDEVLINGRRYRVPERIITLDFWDKIARNRRGESASEIRDNEVASAASSPLTSLSSLDDGESITPLSMEPAMYTLDDVRFAQMLCGLQLQGHSGSSVGPNERAIVHTNGLLKESVGGNRIVKTESQDGPSKVSRTKNPASMATSGSISAETSRPRRAAAPRMGHARSRSSRRSGRSGDDEIAMDVDFELPPLNLSSGKRPDARRKAARLPGAEATSHASTVSVNGSGFASHDKGSSTPISAEPPFAPVSSRPKRSRQAAQRLSSTTVTIKPDPDLIDTDTILRPPISSRPSGSVRRKLNDTASSISRKPITPPTANGQTSVNSESKTQTTPTLKIRLPRLGAFNSPSTGAQPPAPDPSKTSPSKVTTSAASTSHPRRSLRKPISVPRALNSASVSDTGSSSRVNDARLSASPVGSA